jgi:hypothetical protein
LEKRAVAVEIRYWAIYRASTIGNVNLAAEIRFFLHGRCPFHLLIAEEYMVHKVRESKAFSRRARTAGADMADEAKSRHTARLFHCQSAAAVWRSPWSRRG